MSGRMGPNYMSRADRQIRRGKVIELYCEGNQPSMIADFFGMTADHVRQIVLNAGARQPAALPDAKLVSSMWEMDEDARREAFIRRASRGARETLSRRAPIGSAAEPTAHVPRRLEHHENK